jgi:hypothetical protein
MVHLCVFAGLKVPMGEININWATPLTPGVLAKTSRQGLARPAEVPRVTAAAAKRGTPQASHGTMGGRRLLECSVKDTRGPENLRQRCVRRMATLQQKAQQYWKVGVLGELLAVPFCLFQTDRIVLGGNLNLLGAFPPHPPGALGAIPRLPLGRVGALLPCWGGNRENLARCSGRHLTLSWRSLAISKTFPSVGALPGGHTSQVACGAHPGRHASVSQLTGIAHTTAIGPACSKEDEF